METSLAITTNQKAGGVTVRLSLTARGGFVAPPGYVLLSVDFSSQELYIAAVLSKDETMLTAFSSEEVLPLLDTNGNPVYREGQQVFYPNPDADLHTLTCKDCCFPHLFEGKPKHEWVSIAKNDLLISQKGKPRDYAKRVNFGIIYGQTAKAMSDLYHVPEELCERWIRKHEETYPGFHQWAKEIGHLCTVRGWSLNKDGRIRWVAEDNSKQAGASPARSGVNFQIQGYGSSQIKRAMYYVYEAFLNTNAKICMLVHDELVCCVPGQLELDREKCVIKNGLLKPVYKADAEATKWGQLCKNLMEKAQCETFDQEWPGRSEVAICKMWSK